MPPPPLMIAVLVSMTLFSACSWIATWRDKRNSEAGGPRVPERTLHILELLGGWPGSALARRRFRHKTRKWSFRIVSWLCTVTHVAVVGAVLWHWRTRPWI